MSTSAQAINEDEIVTLPEETVTQQTNLKRSFPIESFVNYRPPDSDTSVSKIPRPTFSASSQSESSPLSVKQKKVPPPTLPKPRWYVEQMQSSASASSSSSLPVKQAECLKGFLVGQFKGLLLRKFFVAIFEVINALINNNFH